MLTLEAYNEAGEIVKTIGTVQLSSAINGMLMKEGGNVTDIFSTSDGALSIFFPGVGSPGSTGGVSITWDGKNNSGMDVSPGIYYIKAEVTDNYGHVNTLTEEVTVLNTEQWVRISIYNEAGELVDRLQTSILPTGTIKFEPGGVLLVGGGAAPVPFKYASDGMILWDGRNSFGQIVSSGIYEIQLDVKTKSGYDTVMDTETVTVLAAQAGKVIGDVKAYPNPYYLESDNYAPMTIDWSNKTAGTVTIRIYNLAGELVWTGAGLLDSMQGMKWALSTSGGRLVASGIYVCYLHAKTAAGAEETKSIKIAVVQKYIFDNDRVN
jgi:flagellar hook assembly protein FlgD